MDTAWCFDWAPVPQSAGKFWDCHDTAQFGSAIIKVYLDGVLVNESPVLRVVESVWPIWVPLPRNATFLRIVAMRGPTRGDEDGLAGMAQVRNALSLLTLFFLLVFQSMQPPYEQRRFTKTGSGLTHGKLRTRRLAQTSDALWSTLGPAVRKGPQNAYDFVDVVHAGFVAAIPYTLVPSHSCAAGSAMSNYTCDKNHSMHGAPSDNCAAQAAAVCDKTNGCGGFSIAPCPGDPGQAQVLCDRGATGDVAVLCRASAAQGRGVAAAEDEDDEDEVVNDLSANFWRKN
jgi:hypothetical protein